MSDDPHDVHRTPTAATSAAPIICRGCGQTVRVSVMLLCVRGSGCRARRYAECDCRSTDANGLLLIPGPRITADELETLGAEIAFTAAAQVQPQVRCAECGKPAAALCDYVVAAPAEITDAKVRSIGIHPATSPAQTCDAGMCADHRHKIGRGKDVCRVHVPPARRSSGIKAIEMRLPF